MLNRVILMGRLTADPELRHTQNNTPVAGFKVAIDRPARKGEEKQADFIDVVAWSGTAEFVCKYFGKGKLIAIDGRMQTRTWEDKQGSKRKTTEVIAENVSFCGDRGGKADAGEVEFDAAAGEETLPF